MPPNPTYRFWTAAQVSGSIGGMTIEEALRAIEGKAALVRYLASSATLNPEVPDPALLSGMSDACSEIEDMVRALKGHLTPGALEIELPLRH